MTFTPRHLLLAGTCALALPAGLARADQVINDDLIVTFSACIGNDCVNGESFGFDTLRLKENNLRIKAQDTSNSASFPTNDWQITFNDSTNGGANKFSIDDIDGGRTPFTIEAGTRTNALYVESDGNIGMGTNNPTVDMHIVTGNTPTLRLDQDGSSGFTPQTWDVAGNEAGFFIRDATSGSTLPFRILSGGAPSQSLVIDGDGDVGIGAGTNPGEALHVRRTDGSAKVLIEEASGTAAARGLLEMRNNGIVFFTLEDTSIAAGDDTGRAWNFQNQAGTFRVTTAPGGAGDIEMILTPAGDMTIEGALTQNSDKTKKMAIEPVDPGEILQKVADLPVSSWMYKDNAELGIRHIGPMAQDFHASFGVGASETGISSLDTSGVALAAIQALASENAELKARLSRLEDRLAE